MSRPPKKRGKPKKPIRQRPPLADSRPTRIVTALATAIVCGLAFRLLHLPIPWLLGPMLGVLVGSAVWKGRYEWPGQARNAGMIIVGYTIGCSITAVTVRAMGRQLPTMLLMTLLLVLMCSGIAFIISRLSGIDYMTVLMASVPGGLTQVIALAEETDGINLTVVTVFQVIRLMMIIVCIPLLIFSPILGQHHGDIDPQAASVLHHSGGDLLLRFLLFAAVCIACALAGNKIRFPTAFLLGPAIGTAALQLCGLHGPSVPALLINAAQLMIGTYVGLLLKPGSLTRKLWTLSLALTSALLLITGTLGLSLLLTRLHPVSMSTSLLALAPGGTDQMGIIAHEIHADLSMVAGYQLFRTFFIFFAVPPLFRGLLLRYRSQAVKSASAAETELDVQD